MFFVFFVNGWVKFNIYQEDLNSNTCSSVRLTFAGFHLIICSCGSTPKRASVDPLTIFSTTGNGFNLIEEIYHPSLTLE